MSTRSSGNCKPFGLATAQVAEKFEQLRGLADAATAAQQSLEHRIAGVDNAWSDAARRGFEADHLAPIRVDARHLRDALAEIAADLGRAIRSLDRS